LWENSLGKYGAKLLQNCHGCLMYCVFWGGGLFCFVFVFNEPLRDYRQHSSGLPVDPKSIHAVSQAMNRECQSLWGVKKKKKSFCHCHCHLLSTRINLRVWFILNMHEVTMPQWCFCNGVLGGGSL
jgi:hypothetical protein